jgi:hypothetical protein
VSDKGIGGVHGMGYNLGHWVGWSMELDWEDTLVLLYQVPYPRFP